MFVLCDLGDTVGSACSVIVVFDLKTWRGYDLFLYCFLLYVRLLLFLDHPFSLGAFPKHPLSCGSISGGACLLLENDHELIKCILHARRSWHQSQDGVC